MTCKPPPKPHPGPLRWGGEICRAISYGLQVHELQATGLICLPRWGRWPQAGGGLFARGWDVGCGRWVGCDSALDVWRIQRHTPTPALSDGEGALFFQQPSRGLTARHGPRIKSGACPGSRAQSALGRGLVFGFLTTGYLLRGRGWQRQARSWVRAAGNAEDTVPTKLMGNYNPHAALIDSPDEAGAASRDPGSMPGATPRIGLPLMGQLQATGYGPYVCPASTKGKELCWMRNASCRRSVGYGRNL